MDSMRHTCRQLESRYALVQGSFFGATALINGFNIVFLTWLGLGDAAGGLVNGLCAAFTVAGQLLVSAHLDRHPDSPIKRAIFLLMLGSIFAAAALFGLPLPAAMAAAVFVAANALSQTCCSLLAALLMRFVNIGLPVDFAWPRGVGSICYAALAYVMGGLIDRYSPRALLPCYIGAALLSVLAVLAMPEPEKYRGRGLPEERILRPEGRKPAGGYLDMLKHNRTLLLLCLAAALCWIGQAPNSAFLFRIIQSMGGGTREFGLAVLIQSGVELPMMLLFARISRRIPPKGMLVICFCSYALRHFLLAVVTGLGQLYAVMLLNMLCFGIWGCASVIFANQIVPREETVRAQSLVSLSTCLGGILGSMLTGAALERFGMTAVLHGGWILVALSAGLMIRCSRVCRRDLHI